MRGFCTSRMVDPESRCLIPGVQNVHSCPLRSSGPAPSPSGKVHPTCERLIGERKPSVLPLVVWDGSRCSPSRRRHPLGDLAVVASAVLRRALRRPDGLGSLQAVSLGAAGRVGQRVGASVHHDGVHAVGHGEGLQVGLDGDGQRQLVDEVDRRARHDGSAAQVLQAEHCKQEDRDQDFLS